MCVRCVRNWQSRSGGGKSPRWRDGSWQEEKKKNSPVGSGKTVVECGEGSSRQAQSEKGDGD